MDLTKLRNIGISAHIDSGKTTLSERILYYAGRIHRMQEVHDQSGGGATMDHMELEKERGITITSAATQVTWGDATINLIDTPGHVDFTVEVERSLRVLDGAILVLCAVGGVQAQSLTIDRQMRRYHVPRLAFINKMDRVGADPQKVVEQLRVKLGCDAMLMQLPIGREADYQGVIDLVTQRAYYFDGPNGEEVREEPIPAALADEAHAARHRLLEALSMYSDELMELLLGEHEPPPELIYDVVRSAVAQLEFTPVLLGSAYRNKGVQLLLDAVVRLLPSPLDCHTKAFRKDREGQLHEICLTPDPEQPTVAMAFKMVEDPYGTLTFMRLYQGRFCKGGTYVNQRTGRKEHFSRIVRMHADQRADIDEAQAGDIVAVLGVDCASGDTYASERNYCTLENMFVPEPVIRLAIAPLTRDGADRLSKALHRFRREDPTLQISTDDETGETIMAGMGELHLEIYVERIRREYNVEVEVGAAEGELPRGPHAGRRVQHAPPETDRRLRPICPHRRPARRAAGGRRREISLRGARRRGADSQAVHPRGGEGVSFDAGQGAHRPISGRQPGGLFGGRVVPRGRQFRPGLSSLCPDGDARSVSADPSGALGTGDEDRDRVPQPVSGPGGGQFDLAPGHRADDQGARPRDPHRG